MSTNDTPLPSHRIAFILALALKSWPRSQITYPDVRINPRRSLSRNDLNKHSRFLKITFENKNWSGSCLCFSWWFEGGSLNVVQVVFQDFFVTYPRTLRCVPKKRLSFSFRLTWILVALLKVYKAFEVKPWHLKLHWRIVCIFPILPRRWIWRKLAILTNYDNWSPLRSRLIN